jgi:hypothetical protein
MSDKDDQEQLQVQASAKGRRKKTKGWFVPGDLPPGIYEAEVDIGEQTSVKGRRKNTQGVVCTRRTPTGDLRGRGRHRQVRRANG